MYNNKLFLELPLNDGTYYKGDGCGCIKGNFLRACGLADLGKVSTSIGVIPFEEVFQWELSLKYPKLQTALDIAEDILLKGYPQKAKLFFATMVEKYSVIPANFEKPQYKSLNLEYLCRVNDVVSHNQKSSKLSNKDLNITISTTNGKFTPAVTKVTTRQVVKV